jgi:predicted acylesterase/phospholipase RssA
MNDEDKSKYSYDIISGVSAGSINSFAISLFPKGEEKTMV